MRIHRPIQVYRSLYGDWKVYCPRCCMVWLYGAGRSETAIWRAFNHAATWHPKKAA